LVANLFGGEAPHCFLACRLFVVQQHSQVATGLLTGRLQRLLGAAWGPAGSA
jgi:hypothetical protein